MVCLDFVCLKIFLSHVDRMWFWCFSVSTTNTCIVFMGIIIFYDCVFYLVEGIYWCVFLGWIQNYLLVMYFRSAGICMIKLLYLHSNLSILKPHTFFNSSEQGANRESNSATLLLDFKDGQTQKFDKSCNLLSLYLKADCYTHHIVRLTKYLDFPYC